MILDRHITVFRVVTGTGGVQKRVNLYKDIKASFRELTDQEKATAHESQADSTCQFTINRRLIQKGDFVEYTRSTFGKTVYEVDSRDDYDEHSLQMKIRCHQVEHGLAYTSEE